MNKLFTQRFTGFLRLHPRATFLLTWAGLFLFATLLAAPSLSQDWFNDDLYLLQPYTNAHILRGLQGNYLPADELGTLGYRPLTVLYYHTVGSLAGENTAIARLLQISLFTLALTVIVGAARTAGMTKSAALCAVIFTLTFRNTWWMLVWPTDGVRNFMLLWGAAALWSGLYFVRQSRWYFGALAILFYTLAIFTREEALVFAVLLPLITLAVAKQWRRSLVLGVGCAIVSTVLLLLRAHFVPNAPRVTSIDFAPLLLSVLDTYMPRLFETLPMGVSVVGLLIVWSIALFRMPRRAWLWLLASAVALAPNIIVARANNLLLPLTFLGLFFAEALLSPLKTARWSRALSGVAIALLIGGSIVSHRLAQNALAPDSVDRVLQAQFFLTGEWQYALDDIPPQRLDSLYRAAERTPQLLTRWLNGGW